MTDDTIECARGYAERGWRVIQLHGVNPTTGEGCTCRLGKACKSTGKHPVLDEWQQQPQMTAADIAEAWSGWRASHNVGLATGRDSGFWVLDVDPEKGGFESVKRLLADHGVERFPETHVVRTGSGGIHYYFAMPDGQEVTNSPGRLKTEGYTGIDVRGTGGQVVAPPSASDKGAYTTLKDVPVAPAPAWLLELIRPSEAGPKVTASDVPVMTDLDPAEAERLARYTQRAVEANIRRLRELAVKGWQGEPWNNTCFEVACSLQELANSPWNAYTGEQALRDFLENAPVDNEGFDARQHHQSWESATRKIGDKARALPEDKRNAEDDLFNGPDVRVDPRLRRPSDGERGAESHPVRRDMPRRTWDDLGNAMRLVDYYGSTLRWLEKIGQWAVYTDAGKWELHGDVEARTRVQAMFDELIPEHEAHQYSDTDLHPSSTDNKPVTWREAFDKWLAGQRMSARISAALVEAKGRPELQAARDDFDRHPMLLNCANGVVDLTTGSLRDHDPSLLLMQQSPVAYDAEAKAPEWERFLERVQPDADQRRYLQRCLGYSITGDIGERAFFIHHGNGANGKSVMLQVVSYCVGDYSHVVDRNALLSKPNGQSEHPTAVAGMAGRRFLQVEETAAGKRLEEGLVKSLTGGEKITARFMGKDWFVFTPCGKLQYVTNHLPRLSDADSIWERTHLISWRVSIPRPERDKALAGRLISNEAEGILAWLVRGVMMWLREGLNPPETALRELAEYRDEQDAFADFLHTRTVRTTDDAWCSVDLLFGQYRTWCFDNGVPKPMSKQAFSAVMKERGFTSSRRPEGRGFHGVTTKATEHRQADAWAL